MGAPDPIGLSTFNREEVVSLSRTNVDFLASLLMPDQYIHAFPALLLTVWNIFLQTLENNEKIKPNPKEKFPQIALGWPRGHLKTTLIKLLAVYCIIFTRKKFILVVASNLQKAQNIVADIMDMLGEENVLNIWGNWKAHVDKDTEQLKKFTFNGKQVILAAIGSGGDPRGLNLKNERPDLMLMDDMQSKENSDSPGESKKLLDWMNSTLKKAKSPHGCVFIYVGNMFSSPGCILKKLKLNPEWISVIVAGLVVDMATGKSEALWPELRSKEELMQELKEDIAMGTPEAFFSEIMNNDEAGITSCFDITAVPACPFNPLKADELHASFIIIDVSGSKIRSDDTSIIFYEVVEEIPIVSEIECGIFSPGETIRRALILALRKGCPLIGVECVSYQASLLYWFTKVCEKHAIEGIHFVELHPKGRPKNNRILTMFKSLVGSRTDEYGFQHLDGKPTLYIRDQHRNQVFYEISQFNPTKRDNQDNIIDNMAYAQDILNDYSDLIWHPLSVERLPYEDAKVHQFNSPF